MVIMYEANKTGQGLEQGSRQGSPEHTPHPQSVLLELHTNSGFYIFAG